MKKIDVMVMNPPYQDSGRTGGGVCASNVLWDKFVAIAEELVKDDGYICAVHPSLWRKPGHPVGDTLRRNRLLYLEIHGEKDGVKVFGAETRYDWYVLQKSKVSGKTSIKDQEGKIFDIDMADWRFIPNFAFDLAQKLIAKPGEVAVEMIHDSSYHTQRIEQISDKKSGSFKYPCIYTVPKNGIPRLMWSNRNDKGHFGVPKVIFSTGRPISAGFFVDGKGEYGLTQFSAGIIDTLENLPTIYEALNGSKFRAFCSAISIGKLEINAHIIKYFRKDFWKEFV